MAAPQRKSEAPLTALRSSTLDLLEREGWRFGFFQAVQLLHRLVPGGVPVGELGPAAREAVRFRHDPELVFHTSDVAGVKLTRAEGSVSAVMTTTFLGLFGTMSPLGTVFAEEVLHAESQDETALRAFYDLLHHRLISLFYRAWKKHRFYAGFHTDASDVFTRRMLAFVGTDAGGAVAPRGLPPLEVLALAPLVATTTRSARTLHIVLERMMPGVGVTVTPFVFRTVRVRDEERCLLGRQNNVLGRDLTVGRSVPDRSGRFRVVVGPVDYSMFDSLMPGGHRHARMRDVIVQFSPAHLEPELEIVLGAEHAPRFRLARESGARLGVSTHLASGAPKAMRARVVLSEQMAEAVPKLFSEDDVPTSVVPPPM